MKTAVVSFKTLFDDKNVRSCMSVKRALGKCHKCELYKNCESKIVNPKYEDLMKKKSDLLKELNILSEEIKEL